MKRSHVVGHDGETCSRCEGDLVVVARAGARWPLGTVVVVDGETVRPLGPFEDPPKVCQARREEPPRKSRR